MTQLQSNKEDIISYYDLCEIDYKFFWDLDSSMAMHAGYWDAKTKTLREALSRENEVLAEWGGILPGEKILDAGCGVGGSSIFLAQKYQCEVIGITLSRKQAETARIRASEKGVGKLAQFQVEDFCETHFPNEYFDVVWAIESVCHTNHKDRFIQEASRLLKKGGRLIIADGFLSRSLTFKEQEQMKKWLRGWGVENLETVEFFNQQLEHFGFKNIQYRDITTNVLPSSKRLFFISLPAFIFSKIGELVHLRSPIQTKNILSAYHQYQTLSKGFWNYGVFIADK